MLVIYKKLTLLLTGLVMSSVLHAAPLVYIPLGSGNAVIEVDGKTDKIINHYEGVNNPHGLVATPDGEYLFAGSLMEDNKLKEQGNLRNSKLYMVHPAHGHVMQTVAVEGWSHHQAITPDGRYVLSTHPTRNHVSIVDVETAQQITTIETGNAPYYILVTPNGRSAYVSNSGAGTIEEIDTSTWAVTRSLDAGPSPEHMVLSKDGLTLYVNNTRKGTVSAISLDGSKDKREFPIGVKLHGLDISDDGERLFITSRKDEQLVALTPTTGEKQEITLSPAPYHLNSITGTGKVYVSSRSSSLIWVVDQQTLEVTSTIDLPAGEGHQMSIIQPD